MSQMRRDTVCYLVMKKHRGRGVTENHGWDWVSVSRRRR